MGSLLSFLAGLALGGIHVRLYHRMLGSLMQNRPGEPAGRRAILLGLFRYIFTFVAGILLIRVARLGPFPLCGGLFFAVTAYRAFMLAKVKMKETESR